MDVGHERTGAASVSAPIPPVLLAIVCIEAMIEVPVVGLGIYSMCIGEKVAIAAVASTFSLARLVVVPTASLKLVRLAQQDHILAGNRCMACLAARLAVTLFFAGMLLHLLLSQFTMKSWLPFVVAAAVNIVISFCTVALLLELRARREHLPLSLPGEFGLAEASELPTCAVALFVAGPQPASGAPGNCCICLEDFLEADLLGRLNCGHVFHGNCVSLWVETGPGCPMRCPTAVTKVPELKTGHLEV